MLLEDLSAARPGSWEDDPVGDIRTVPTHLAQLLASFWGDPRLQQDDWIVHPTDLEKPPSYKQRWAESLALVKRQHRDQLSEYTWSVCDRSLEYWDEIMCCMGRDTHTLVHTGARLEQMFFPTNELPRFVLFD